MNRTRRSGDRSTVEHQLLLRRSGDPDMYAGPLICSGTSGNNKCRTVTTAGAGRPEEATSVVVQQARSHNCDCDHWQEPECTPLGRRASESASRVELGPQVGATKAAY